MSLNKEELCYKCGIYSPIYTKLNFFCTLCSKMYRTECSTLHDNNLGYICYNCSKKKLCNLCYKEGICCKL